MLIGSCNKLIQYLFALLLAWKRIKIQNKNKGKLFLMEVNSVLIGFYFFFNYPETKWKYIIRVRETIFIESKSISVVFEKPNDGDGEWRVSSLSTTDWPDIRLNNWGLRKLGRMGNDSILWFLSTLWDIHLHWTCKNQPAPISFPSSKYIGK